MNPAIRDGQCIRVLPASNAPLRRGGIILYRIHGRMAVHRLIFHQRETNRLYVAADAALRGGDWIAADDILGVAESVIRDGRTIRLDTRRSRWAGLLCYNLRPLRRMAVAIMKRPTS